jgi:hypothetical protein
MSGDESAGFGPIDADALRDIRSVVTTMEPLVTAARLDDPLNPGQLHVEFEDGIGAATSARIDARWSTRDNYSFHYTDDAGVDYRFDRHPKPDGPRAHFHPPPDAPSDGAVPSCIRVVEIPLVARAVFGLWRNAYERGSVDGINDAANPP